MQTIRSVRKKKIKSRQLSNESKFPRVKETQSNKFPRVKQTQSSKIPSASKPFLPRSSYQNSRKPNHTEVARYLHKQEPYRHPTSSKTAPMTLQSNVVANEKT